MTGHSPDHIVIPELGISTSLLALLVWSSSFRQRWFKCQSFHFPSKALFYDLALTTDPFVGLIVLPMFTAHYLMIILEMSSYFCAIAPASYSYHIWETFVVGVSFEIIATIAIKQINYELEIEIDIICSSYLTVFLELRSRKTVRYSEQIMSADKYPSIFSRQMEAIVYLSGKSGSDLTFYPHVSALSIVTQLLFQNFPLMGEVKPWSQNWRLMLPELIPVSVAWSG